VSGETTGPGEQVSVLEEPKPIAVDPEDDPPSPPPAVSSESKSSDVEQSLREAIMAHARSHQPHSCAAEETTGSAAESIPAPKEIVVAQPQPPEAIVETVPEACPSCNDPAPSQHYVPAFRLPQQPAVVEQPATPPSIGPIIINMADAKKDTEKTHRPVRAPCI